MGSSNSKSSTSQNITNNTINQNLMTTINENLMNVSTDTLIKNASSASSSVNQNNVCKTEVANVAGDLNISSDQGNTASVNFAAVQSASAANDMSTAMMQSMVSQMKSLNGTDNAAALNNAASSASNQGSLTTGGNVNSNTSSKTNVSNDVTNETISYVQNLFSQNINNNFSAETVNQCIGKTTQTNEQDVKAGNVGGNAKVSCIQTNSVEQVQRCEQLAQAINETMLKTASELGLTVVAESETKTDTESSISASSSATQTGLIQDGGNFISGIIDSFGGIISGLSTGTIVFIIGLVVVACIGIWAVFFSGKDLNVSKEGISVTSNSSGSNQGSYQGYPPQGYPPQGYPAQGYPPQGYPPQGPVWVGGAKGSKSFDSSTSFILSDSSSSSSIYDSSSSSHFNWINAPENILSGASGKNFIMNRDILITL
jgi:hypothetical protein